MLERVGAGAEFKGEFFEFCVRYHENDTYSREIPLYSELFSLILLFFGLRSKHEEKISKILRTTKTAVSERILGNGRWSNKSCEKFRAYVKLW